MHCIIIPAGGIWVIFKKAKSNNIRMQQTHELKSRKQCNIYLQKCPTRCEPFPETGRFAGSSSDIISSMMLSACSPEQAFSLQEPWTEGEPELFSKCLCWRALSADSGYSCAKCLLAGSWNDFDYNTQCGSNLHNHRQTNGEDCLTHWGVILRFHTGTRSHDSSTHSAGEDGW